MKRLLLIESLDLSAIKELLSNDLFLLDKLTEAEIETEDGAIAAIADMISADPGREEHFIENDSFIYEGS